VHGLEAEYWGKVDFLYLDREAAANADVVRNFGISYQPVFIFLAPDGTEVERFFGGLSEQDLRQNLDDLIASTSG
jgi:thioredoxin-like negative regulator of GroEL